MSHDFHYRHLPFFTHPLRDCLKTQDRCRTEASRGYETKQRGLIFASRATNFMVEIALRLLFRQSLSEVRSYRGKGYQKMRLALLGVIILGCKH